jgi:penicillin-binding protein 1C
MKRKVLMFVAPVLIAAGVFAVWQWAIAPIRRAPQLPTSARVLARDGTLLYEALPSGGGAREAVSLSALPASVTNAVLAAEDDRFYAHHGVDFLAIGRAVRDRILSGPSAGGASTIEQQLLKNLFYPSAKRNIPQKIRETIGALYWSATHSKQQTLELYLNTVPFGNGSSGIQSAAQSYFHTSAAGLSTAQAALLAGVIAAPGAYDPFLHWTAAHARERTVLGRMVRLGMISPDDGRLAADADVPVFAPLHQITAPHFVLRLLDELERTIPDIRSGGYVVHTTLDPGVQRTVEDTVSRRLLTLRDQAVTDAAAMAVDPRTGDVLAYVGSADYFDAKISGQVDMVRAQRQPGSSLKPFMYLTALLKGFTAGTVIDDLPVRYTSADGQPYTPHNFSYKYYGPVTLRDALGSSLNVPAVNVLNTIGLDSFFGTLHGFGIDFPEAPSHYGLGIVLGGGEVSLEDELNAYAGLARQGGMLPLRFITSVDDASGRHVITHDVPQTSPIFSDTQRSTQAIGIISDILSDKKARYKAFGEANLLDVGSRIAVKTGTTKDYHDNWAFGYTPSFVLGIWVGNADNTPMNGVSGITGAVPIWHDIMRAEAARVADAPWPDVPGLSARDICVTSGLLANGICPKTRREIYLPGTEPTTPDTWYVRCPNGRIYLNPPQRFAAWIQAAGYESVPVGSCSAAVSAVTIISPADGDGFVLDTHVDPVGQRIPFMAAGPKQPAYVWRLNGQTIRSAEPTYLWNPTPGDYTLTLDGVSGQIRFSVQE